MPTVDVGVNSYISRSDANDYFDDNLQFEAWNALDDDTKDRSLITSSGQISLAVKDECKLPINPADITQCLKDATCEYAIHLATNPDSVTSGSTANNTKRAKAGSAEVEFFRPSSDSVERFPPNVMDYLRSCGCLAGGGALSAVAKAGAGFTSGTDEQSTFEDPNPFGKTEGYP